MGGIDLIVPQLESTICAPVSYVQTLTTADNAQYLWKLGFVAGVIACISVWVCFQYIGPWIYYYGKTKGWW
jgi:hypothetical protein